MKKHQNGWRLADALLATFIVVGLICAAFEIVVACSCPSFPQDILEVWP